MSPPEGRAASVLIADDDALVRSVLRIALTRAGFTVAEACDAVEVIAAVQTHHPDLVVLDINMPGGSLEETLSALRARQAEIPILVLSGEAEPPYELLGTTFDFARKPISLDDLLTRVNTLLDHPH
jgi:two-component system OmpR family response regulator